MKNKILLLSVIYLSACSNEPVQKPTPSKHVVCDSIKERGIDTSGQEIEYVTYRCDTVLTTE
jgi:hypothetical protein